MTRATITAHAVAFRLMAAAAAMLMNAATASGQVDAAAADVAADDDPVPVVSDLAAPTTPAVTLLDGAPTSIERPDNPRAFVINLAAAVAADSGVPRSFGLSLTPYWMRWHPRLSFDSYARPTVLQSLARSLSVSIATADWQRGSGRTADDLGSRLAVGLSAIVYPGRSPARILDASNQLSQTLLAYAEAVKAKDDAALRGMRAYRRQLAAALAAAAHADPIAPEEIVRAQRALADADAALQALTSERDAQIARLDSRRLRLAREIANLDEVREGLRLAVAGARGWAVPADVFRNTRNDRTAAWATASYRFGLSDDDDALELLGVVRYMREPALVASSPAHAWDSGGRIVWHTQKTMAVSMEVVRRAWNTPERDDSYRAAAMFEARIGPSAYLFAAFGRGHQDRSREGTLLSIVGLNIGLGTAPAITY